MSAVFSPAAFSQNLRRMRYGWPADQPLLVVEGVTDRRALTPVLVPGVKVIPSNGKEHLKHAYQELVTSGVTGIYYIMDCDNGDADEFMGLEDLAVTQHRDIEADLLFSLNAFERVADEFLSEFHPDRRSLHNVADRVLEVAAANACTLGRLKDAAREAGLVLKVRDARTGRKRALRPADIASAIPFSDVEDQDAVAREMAVVLAWGEEEVQDLLSRAEHLDVCEHGSPMCYGCAVRAVCNGHDVVQALALAISAQTNLDVTSEELERALRIGMDRSAVEEWHVGARARRWESTSGMRLLR